ncbi:MAG: NAD-binding protein, partial [Anaerolineae bacterium]|nr:NAD-binding protein [Anaerolineae bacterium]
MTMIYREENGDIGFLTGKTVSIIGYGGLGRSVALNLRDSGLTVLVAEVNPERAEQSRLEGFRIVNTADAVQQGQVILLLTSN